MSLALNFVCDCVHVRDFLQYNPFFPWTGLRRNSQTQKRNYVSKCEMINKTQMHTVTLVVNPTQCLESVLPVSNILPGRLPFVCWWIAFRGWAVFCWLKTTPAWRSVTSTVDLAETEIPLQVWMPSVHEWSNFGSPASPQFLNQAPPRAQQLRLPTLLVAHLTHALLLTVGRLFCAGASVEAVQAWT